MTDIFHHWKENRFIIAPDYVRDSDSEHPHMVILTDIGFWADNVDHLVEWCNNYGCKTQGMTVEIPTDDLLTAFCIRWA